MQSQSSQELIQQLKNKQAEFQKSIYSKDFLTLNNIQQIKSDYNDVYNLNQQFYSQSLIPEKSNNQIDTYIQEQQFFNQVFQAKQRQILPSIYSGKNSVEKDLLNILNTEKINKKCLLIATPSIKNSPVFNKIQKILEENQIEYILSDSSKTQTPYNLVLETVQAQEKQKVDDKFQFDFILSVGGSSVADFGKTVRFGLLHGSEKLEASKRGENQLSSERKVKNQELQHIIVPTTLSGAETTFAAGMVDSGKKFGAANFDILPNFVLLDDEMIQNTKKDLWLETGIKCFSDYLDCITARTSNQLNDPFALANFKILSENLGQQDKRIICLQAVQQACPQIFLLPARSLTAAFRYCIGAQYPNVGHGAVTAVMIPHVLEFNFEFCKDKLGLMSIAIGISKDSEQNLEKAAQEFIQYVKDTIKGLGIGTTLKEIGVPEGSLEKLADNFNIDLPKAANPRPIEDKKQILELLQKAF